MRFWNSVRPYVGGVAMAFGCIGLFLFVLAIPLTLFGAHFWGGFGFREGPQPTSDQLRRYRMNCGGRYGIGSCRCSPAPGRCWDMAFTK
jgi:hypothetical protein